MPEQISTEELSATVNNVILTYYVRPSEERGASSRLRIVDREILVLKIRDSAFDAYPEVFHITDARVRFGRSESVDLRPDAATAPAKAHRVATILLEEAEIIIATYTSMILED